jgi:hypothetical protein
LGLDVIASLDTLVVAGYVFACSLAIPRPGPQGLITDQELIALAVAQAVTGLPSDRQFLGVIGKLPPGYFPYLPDQPQYNRRLRRLTPQITAVQLMVAELVGQRQWLSITHGVRAPRVAPGSGAEHRRERAAVGRSSTRRSSARTLGAGRGACGSWSLPSGAG